MAHEDASVQQTNEGDSQRIAGRDFIEYALTQYTDIKLYMLTVNEAALDALSIESERNFKYRFGKHYNEPIRQTIIALKQQHHYTEREIKHLLLANGISVNKLKNTVKLNQDRFAYCLGWLFIIFMFVQTAGNLFLLTFYSQSPAWRITLGQLTIAGVFIASIWLCNWIFIAPYHILQRSHQQQARS